MKQILSDYLLNIDSLLNQIPETLSNQLFQGNAEKKYKTKEYILSANEICKYIYFIKTGSAWKFYVNNGKKVATEFVFAEDIILSFPSYIKQTPSNEYIQVLEESIVSKIEFGKFEKLKVESKILTELDNLLLEYQILKLENRLYSIQFKSSKERFDWVNLMEPKLVKKVPSKYVASYLGISLETLVRLKKRLI